VGVGDIDEVEEVREVFGVVGVVGEGEGESVDGNLRCNKRILSWKR
jgi:hypothetical protein